MKFILLPLLLVCGIIGSIATQAQNPKIRNIQHVTIGGMAKYIGFDVPVNYKLGSQTVVVISMGNTGMYNTTANAVFEKIYEADTKWAELNEKITGVFTRLNNFEDQIKNIVRQQYNFNLTINNLQQKIDKSTKEIHEQKTSLELISEKITNCDKCQETYKENSKIKNQLQLIRMDISLTENKLQNEITSLKSETEKFKPDIDAAIDKLNKTIPGLIEWHLQQENLALTPRSVGPPVKLVKPPPAKKEKLLEYFMQLSSSKTISGVCFDEGEEDFNIAIETIETNTDVLPGILTMQMPTVEESDASKQSFVTEAINLWNCGYLLNIFFWDNPLTIKERLQSLAWADLTRDNGRLNQEWKTYLDSLVPYLRQFQNANITLIIDPLPRLNSGHPKWGGRPGANGSFKLYQLTHDHLTKHHGLTSFLWAWSLNGEEDMTQLRNFWPGTNYVDVVSVYMYTEDNLDYNVYHNLLDIVGDKPISFECMSAIPSQEVFELEPKLSWFTLSSNYISEVDSQTLENAFLNPSVVNKGNFFSMINGIV